MSATTFSNMSTPDIIISLEAYCLMHHSYTVREDFLLQCRPGITDLLSEVRKALQRVDELIDALLNEYFKRQTN